jgi:hypothetical protein
MCRKAVEISGTALTFSKLLPSVLTKTS